MRNPIAHIRRTGFKEALTPAPDPRQHGWALIGPQGTVAGHVSIAATPFRRMKGWLGRKQAPPGSALVLMPCAQVHTIGMRFPIDAVFCDETLHVVRVRTLVRGRMTWTVKGAHCCIELPAGAAAANGLVAGAPLRFERAVDESRDQG
jgi:hypothetical protein